MLKHAFIQYYGKGSTEIVTKFSILSFRLKFPSSPPQSAILQIRLMFERSTSVESVVGPA